MREIADRNRLEEDRHDLRLALEQTNIGRLVVRPVGGEQSRFAIERFLRAICAKRREPRGGQAVAGRDSGLEEHLVGAGVGPLILPADEVGRKRQRARRRCLIEAEQPAAGGRRGERSGETGRPEASGEFRRHDRPADAAADLVSDDRRGGEAPPVDAPLLRKREQRRQNDDAKVADAAGVHVLAHEPMSGDAVGEDGVDRGRVDARPYDRAGTRSGGSQRLRLPGPRQPVRLERAGKEIEQANPEFFASGGGNVALPLGRDRGRHADGKRSAAGCGRFCQGDGTRHRDLP